MSETEFKIEVRPKIPEKLAGIEKFTDDLMYSWDRGIRGLFYRLDPKLWEEVNHNPKVFLRRVSQAVLNAAAEDHVFIQEFNRVITAYATYHEKSIHPYIENVIDPNTDLIAYFCTEYGFHESFPIYSGGLGILAGDHCKAASDLSLPFIAIGLLYRHGYFTQTIDGEGSQIAHFQTVDFDDLLISPARDQQGKELRTSVNIDNREVSLKIWKAKAGHILLYLLDTDIAENTETDRAITMQLYGGDKEARIQQEIVLGIGGVRALRVLGLKPNVWHINEGHAAFQIIERCSEYVKQGLDFNSALELVAAGTVFTTHTPVAAGHDIFDIEQIKCHFEPYIKSLEIDLDEFLSLGHSPGGGGGFNMTDLAFRGSRFHNGVSKIHGDVASAMEGYIWPQIPHSENPIRHVTNGVHVPTFLAREWVSLFDMRFREWRNELLNNSYWRCIDSIPDHRFWSLRQELKAEMMNSVCQQTISRFERSGHSGAMINRLTHFTSQPESNVLVLGFARRFATYKRATLLLADYDRLVRLLNDPKRPVMIIYAGKAHPNDIPGQELIRTIHEYSLRPELVGKIILLEGYDIALARKLVTGVDVWVNTPEYPMEASGTSGEKAAINGVINLSVLDGWWGEAYNGENGWAIHPHAENFNHEHRNREEASDLMNLIENEIIPMYFDHGNQGYSARWVKMSKASMESCIPRFNSQRMVVDYVNGFYISARDQSRRLSENACQPAKQLAAWKHLVHKKWDQVSIQRIDDFKEVIQHGDILPIKISAYLNGLSYEDVSVECLVGKRNGNKNFEVYDQLLFNYIEQQGENFIFQLDLEPMKPGLNFYKLRIFPHHALLSHRFELGCMIWI
ncbi:alpha-glucan family phosphorylase [Beggiatoa alba]|nr:alpha-glucan family phosphorylase [Beggiatoa alba]